MSKPERYSTALLCSAFPENCDLSSIEGEDFQSDQARNASEFF